MGDQFRNKEDLSEEKAGYRMVPRFLFQKMENDRRFDRYRAGDIQIWLGYKQKRLKGVKNGMENDAGQQIAGLEAHQS
jgi:hypothetical protein